MNPYNERANRAAALLDAYRALTGTPVNGPMDAETYTADILADFMHLADREGFDFSTRAQMAAIHHENEVAGE